MSTEMNLPDDPSDFSLADWLTTGTVARQHVTIHADQEAGKRLAEIQARLDELGHDGAADPEADSPLGADGDGEVAGLLAEAETLVDRWEQSKATWEVRALSADEVAACIDLAPVPTPPVAPAQHASPEAQRKFAERAMAFARKQTEAHDQQRMHMIARAVVSVTTARGTVPGVTVDDLRDLKARPHGKQWLDRLYAAIEKATEEDVEVPRPTWPGSSTSTRD